MIFGCDVSSFQHPLRVPWTDPKIGFANIKASDGSRRDVRALDHVAAVRKADKPLSLYHFFRPDEDPHLQFATFDAIAKDAQYGKGDILPDVDIEYFKGHEVTPAWCRPLREFIEDLTQAFGKRPIIYCNNATWVCLGRPDWLLECLIWVPWYPVEGHAMPLALPGPKQTPGGKDWTIWQFGAGKMFGKVQEQYASYSVDQNYAKELPRIEQ